MEQTSTAGLTAALQVAARTGAALSGGAPGHARRWRRCTSAITRPCIATAGRSCTTTRTRAMRCRARWPRRWRPCATRSATSRCGPGCSGSPTTRRSRGCASAAMRWTWMRSGRWGRDSLAQTVEDRERLALLRADLRDLPERQRAALVLRELSGLSHEEIAVVLDSSARAVKQTIFEARAGLHECAEGRTMLCADVQRALSDGDGRVLRGRRMRAHVRSCRACREFKTALAQRPADLAALAPALPSTAGAALLAQLLPGAANGRGLASRRVTAARGRGRGRRRRRWPRRSATKVAIVAVAAATLAGTGTVVRDAVTKPRDPRPGRTRRPRHRSSRPLSTPASTPARRARRRPAAGRGVRAARGPAARGATATARRVGAVAPPRRPRWRGGRRARRAGRARGAGPPTARPTAPGQAPGRRRRTAVAPRPKPAKRHPAHPAKRAPAAAAVHRQVPPRAPRASRRPPPTPSRARRARRRQDPATRPRTPRPRATRAPRTPRSSA